MKSNIYLVESPLQALCALEASLRNAGDENIIFYYLSEMSGREKSNNQMTAIIELGGWAVSEAFKVSVCFGKLSAHHGRANLIRGLYKRFSGNADRLYIGEFRSKWMHQARLAIRPKETWLIDDGAATIKIIEGNIKKGEFISQGVFSEASWLSKFFFLLIYRRYQYGLAGLKNKPINVFSAFLNEGDIGHVAVLGNKVAMIRNDFKEVKTFFNESNKSMIDEVYYYGSKYSEAGIVSLAYEITFLRGIKEYYLSKGIVVRYFSHRDESPEKLDEVENVFPNMVMLDSDMAEIYLLKAQELPSEISAAYSSMLVNLNILFPKIKKTSFRLNPSEIKGQYSNDIKLVYEFIEGQGISVINI
jgi:hypothetical protein